MNMHLPRLLGAVLLTCASASPLSAAPRLPSLFSDGMVLQRDAKNPIWGWAEPGEKVTVSLSGQFAEAVADSDGRWMVQLPPLPAGGPHTLAISGSSEISVKDVLIGEVWLCSGQSWMTWDMGRVRDSEKEIANAHSPQIRMFTVKKHAALTPQNDCEGIWTAISPQTARPLSALAYFFGRELQAELGVPIGLIHSSVPGTVAWAWTDRESLLEKQELKAWVDATDRLVKEYGGVFYQEYGEKIREWVVASGEGDSKKRVPAPTGLYASFDKLDQWREWLAEAERAVANGRDVPLPPEPEPVGSIQDPRYHAYRQTSMLFNGMIHPLVPFNIAGVVWFQGTGGDAFLALINAWRRHWGRELPFFFVQLPNYEGPGKNPEGIDLAKIREDQAAALKLPNTGMAVAIDIGKLDDLHPTNMQDYASRLSRIALAKVYGKDIEYSGPIFQEMKVDGDKIQVSFSNAEDGLIVKGDGTLKGFQLAGADGKFVPADAVVVKGTVVASSPVVSNPKDIRYAFSNAPDANLYNRAGLPAAPFRSDRR